MSFWEWLFRHKQETKQPSTYVPASVEWYVYLWERLAFDAGYEDGIESTCRLLLKNKVRYQAVSLQSNVPWYVIACIHHMEASANFNCVLHNGEKIIGTNQKTRLVPKDRGPFATWEEAAVDALRYDNFYGLKDWSIGTILKRCEAYNGLGYLKHHATEKTPYLWAQTNHNDGHGKYVSDGKWSDTQSTNARPGIAAILKKFQLMGEIVI